jgi:RNA polymerase sigma factor for flagellar operon FliA
MKFKKLSKEQKQELWANYRDNRDDLKAYNDLLEAYLPLVEIIAVKSKSKLPAQIEVGDLINDGFFGLVDALEKFDESKGYTFETYASTRIRGEINDRLRDYDWVSRYARLKFKLISQTESLLLEELQREPSDTEIADRIGIDMDELNKIRSNYFASFPVNIDEYMSDSTHESFSLSELLPDESDSSVEYEQEYKEISSVVEKALFSLSEHQSIVVYLHLYEELKFKEIAEMLGVSDQKIKKVYDSGLEDLQRALGVY